jgi:hypothetical protein
MDPATHDLFGNFVDGWYWQLAEDSFQEQAKFFQSVGNRQAAAICKRLSARSTGRATTRGPVSATSINDAAEVGDP